MTPEQRATWRVDPDLWPHTPPLEVFLELYEEDRNLWWKIGCGHHENLFDAAIERIEALEDHWPDEDS